MKNTEMLVCNKSRRWFHQMSIIYKMIRISHKCNTHLKFGAEATLSTKQATLVMPYDRRKNILTSEATLLTFPIKRTTYRLTRDKIYDQHAVLISPFWEMSDEASAWKPYKSDCYFPDNYIPHFFLHPSLALTTWSPCTPPPIPICYLFSKSTSSPRFHQLLVYEAPRYLNNTKQQKICPDLTQKLTFAFLIQNYRSKLERRQGD